MANPIEPTPSVEGEDAERLARELECVADRETIRRRIEAAREFVRRASNAT